jgi:HSP20 family protein
MTTANVETHEEKPVERTRPARAYQPSVDILETKDELTLLANMPGVKPDSIDINFDDGVLTIHAQLERRWPEGANFLMYEYGVGDFYRTFRISEQVDASKIEAKYTAGVLTLHLPKTEAARPRKIAVRAAS